MKLVSKILVLAALLLPLIGQQAKIIIVERRDSDRLKTAYAKYKDAQKEWEKVKTDIAKTYTTDDKGKVMEGWEDVEFSVDFRALVPAHKYASTWGNFTLLGTPTSAVTTSSGMVPSAGAIMDSTADLHVFSGHDSLDGIRSDLSTKERP